MAAGLIDSEKKKCNQDKMKGRYPNDVSICYTLNDDLTRVNNYISG